MYLSFTNRPKNAATSDAPGRRAPAGIRTVSSTVVTLGIVSLLTDISSESVSAVLPLYITGVLGLSTIAFGFLDGLHQGVSALVRIAGGYASDRTDRPKWVAVTGYGLAALARVGLLFAGGFASLTAVVTADRIGKGIRTAPRDAMITATSTPANLSTSFGVHRALDNAGAAIGPLIAFLILLVIPDGYQTIWTASLAFAVVGVVILVVLVPNLRTRRETDAAPRRRFDWRAVTRGPIRRVLAAAGILGLVTIGDGFVYLVLQARGDFAAQWFPLLYVGTNVAFVLFAVPLGRLADRFGRARIFLIGHGGLLAAYAIAVTPIDDVAATVLALLCLGLFYAATDGVLASLAAQLTTPETRATGIAAAQTVVALARFVAATGFGVLWFSLGRENALWIVVGLLVAAIVAAAVLLRPLMAGREVTAP